MVCTFVAQYEGSDTPSSSITFPFTFNPPEEVAGKECQIRLVKCETNQLITPPNETAPVVGKQYPVTAITNPGGIATVPGVIFQENTPVRFANAGKVAVTTTTPTMTNASPTVITWTGFASQLTIDSTFTFLVASTVNLNVPYYVVNIVGNTFQLSTTYNGAANVGSASASAVTAYVTGVNPLPSPLVSGTTYYTKNNNTDAFQINLSTTSGGASITVTNEFSAGPALTLAAPYPTQSLLMNRIPFTIQLGGLTQPLSQYINTVSDFQTLSTYLGTAAINDSGSTSNPSVKAYLMHGPQQFSFTLRQLSTAQGSFLGGSGFNVFLFLQITPITF